MEDTNNSSEELEESILVYIENSQNLFRLGNELNNKLDNFKLEINSLQNEFRTELNSIKLSNQILSKKILKIRKQRNDLNSETKNSIILPDTSNTKHIEQSDENFSSDSSNMTRIDFNQISPKSPSIISHNANLKEDFPFLNEEEAFTKLKDMAKNDGFFFDQMTEPELNQSKVADFDLTLQSDIEINSDLSSKIKKCSVELDRIDLEDLDALKIHKLSSETINYLTEKKALDEDLAIDRLCKINFNKSKNSARKKTTTRNKNLVQSKKKTSDSDSDESDTSNSELTTEQNEDNCRDNLVETMEYDNFDITEDESTVNSELIKAAKETTLSEEDGNSSDHSNTSHTDKVEENQNLISHEYRDSKQTPGFKKKSDIPKLVLDSIESDEEKENKFPGNDESDEEIKNKTIRCSKRLTSETSEDKECSRDDQDFMEDIKKSTCFKGIIAGELKNDPDHDNLSLDNSDTNSSEIKPIVKKRKKNKSTSDSDKSFKSRRITRLSAKKEKSESDCSDQESSSSSDDSDIRTIHSSEEESPNKQETRHKLRNIIHDGKLTKETLGAIQAERERKKRIEDKQSLEESIADKTSHELYLDVDMATKQMLLKVDPALSKHLKPHQVEGIKFMWNSCYESCDMIKNGHKGSGCLLAHCMGLGKTFQVITFVHTLITNKDLTKCKRVLILFPVNVQQNWKKEFRKWTKPCKNQITLYLLPSEKGFSKDLARARLNEIETWHRKGGVLLLSYSMFVRIVNGKNIKPQKLVESFNKCLLSPGPNLVICDEGHMLKVATSALNKSVSRIETARRIVLTGTPLQNNLLEYHCMVSFVKPSLLGTIKEFKNRFANPISNGQHRDSTEADVRFMKKRAHILHDVLDGCVQRKDYNVIRDYLKPKKEYVLSIRLSDIQIELYRAYIQIYSTRTKSVKTKGADLFQDFQNLYRVCSHPWVLKLNEVRVQKKESKLAEKNFLADDYEDLINETEVSDDEIIIEKSTNQATNESKIAEVNGGGINNEDSTPKAIERWWTSYIPSDMEFDINMSGKLVVLEHILRLCAQSGDKLLLFSQSLFSLDLVEIFLEHLSKDKKQRWKKDEDYYRLDGQTDVVKRQQDVDKFNDERNKRSRLFLISTKAGGIGINLVGANRCIIFDACWNPSYDTQSIFRIYRFGQKKDVFVYRFLAQGTMEEKIYQRQVTKQSLSHRVIDEHQIDRHFTSQEINELYYFEPDFFDEKSIVFDIPEDQLLKSLLVDCKRWISKYHEHDSLLENKLNEGLSEEERKVAWEEYENEKNATNIQMNQFEQEFANSYVNKDSIAMSLYNRLFHDESGDPFNEHIQSIQRAHLMNQLNQQNEMRNLIQIDRNNRIHNNQNLQKMEQLIKSNQFNSNIRIPTGQKNKMELTPNRPNLSIYPNSNPIRSDFQSNKNLLNLLNSNNGKNEKNLNQLIQQKFYDKN